MKLLAVDTSGPVCGVAVMTDQGIRYEASVQNKLTHSVNLMPMIDAALTSSGLALSELDRIAVVTGPGSFTGVRLGVSTVKGLAHGVGKPCVAVDALEAMAHGVGIFDGMICPIQDARAGQVYGAAFRGDASHERLMADTPMKLEDAVNTWLTMGERFLFVGDGMPVHRAKLTSLLGDRACFALPPFAFLRPAVVAYLGSLITDEKDYRELMPMYLRSPSAERNRKLMEAAAHV